MISIADPMAELAAMRAKGEIDADQFELAKTYLQDEAAKLRVKTIAAPEARFACTKTVPARGTHILMGSGTLLFGVPLSGLIVPGILHQIIPGVGAWVGVAIVCGVLARGLRLMILGREGYVRKGPCPHCATEVIVRNEQDASSKCPGCKHPILLRDEKLYDVG